MKQQVPIDCWFVEPTATLLSAGIITTLRGRSDHHHHKMKRMMRYKNEDIKTWMTLTWRCCSTEWRRSSVGAVTLLTTPRTTPPPSTQGDHPQNRNRDGTPSHICPQLNLPLHHPPNRNRPSSIHPTHSTSTNNKTSPYIHITSS